MKNRKDYSDCEGINRHWSNFRLMKFAVNEALLLLVVTLLLAAIPLFGADSIGGIVKLDNNTRIPELKPTKKTNPVNELLYIGSWEPTVGTKWSRKPLCSIDTKNNTILIEFPENLLKGARSRTLNRDNQNTYLGRIRWGAHQATHFAFKVTSGRRQPAVVEITTDCKTALFHDGKFAGEVTVDRILDAGGRAYFPVMLAAGENIINIKQFSTKGAPQTRADVHLGHARELQAAWQPGSGLLRGLVNMPKDRTGAPLLEWSARLGHLSVAVDVRDLMTNKIILCRESVHRGGRLHDDPAELAPGIYEAIYRARDERASEFFIVGNPRALFADLQGRLSKHTVDAQARLDIEAQSRRARLLLAEENYDISGRKWQEKIAYTLGCLATINRMLDEGAASVSKDQPGHHIRGFVSKVDNSAQFYKLFVPSGYKPGTPLPLLVMVSTLVTARERPFIAGPVMAAHRHALQWGNYAEKHGFAILWPGYRNAPEGQTYEAAHVEEAIQAIEKDYNIDRHRISVYASCSAGLFAGRLVSEYDNRFAAIVYDRAIFERPEAQMGSIPSFREWCQATNPVRHVPGNRALRIFVMHDNTAEPGHGEMELATQFLAHARKTRDDVIHCLGKRPVGTTPMDMVFSWLAPCRNENPGNTPSRVLAKAGYTGPISEVFGTPFLVVEGTGAQGRDQRNMQLVIEFFQKNYSLHFHGAGCLVKKDIDVTQADIENNSLVLIGNPDSNSVWAGLRRQIPIDMTSSKVLYGDALLTETSAFEAVLPHPHSGDKYILLIGAADLRQLPRVMAVNPFTAWYDCAILGAPRAIIGKLSTFNGAALPEGGAATGMFPIAQPPAVARPAR